tara:strand:- start:667 stop:1353 length:687 start_codon:yes stop_codon:yes gene_type:complete
MPLLNLGMPQFEVVEFEKMKLLRATLQGETVRSESGAMHYMLGNIEMQSKMPGIGKMFKSMATGESVFRPTYTGTGHIFFGPPTFGEYNFLQLNGDAWILDRGAYVASDIGINVDAHRNKGLSMIASGEGIFQTKVEGTGIVAYYSDGPVQEIMLNNQTLTVDGRFAVARQASLNFETKLLGKGIMSKVSGGEGFVNIISGTGKVMLSPIPNLYQGILASINPFNPTM